MKTLLSYILTPIFHFYYILVLLVFHPILVLGQWIGGDKGRQRGVNILNKCFVAGLYIIGSKVRFKGFDDLPTGKPLIIVANHQSIYDIPAVVVAFRKYSPRFISKIELSRNIPTISYDLRKSGSALIDRENGSQSVKEIFRLGKLIEKEGYGACIFPEGTRNEDGIVGEFQPAGIVTLMRAAPSALVVPMVIDGHDRIQSKGRFAMKLGQTITYTALGVIDPKNHKPAEVVELCRSMIKKELGQ